MNILGMGNKRKTLEDIDRTSNHHILSSDEHARVFANAKEILNLHKFFLRNDLSDQASDSTSEHQRRACAQQYEVGSLFVKFAPKLKMYSAFVSTYTDRLDC